MKQESNQQIEIKLLFSWSECQIGKKTKPSHEYLGVFMNVRNIFIGAFLAMGATAFGQVSVGLGPTSGPEQVNVNTAGGAANVTQTLQLTLPQATALHLTTTLLSYDLTTLGTDKADSSMVCVYGIGKDAIDGTDVPVTGVGGAQGYHPLGTYYTLQQNFGFINVKGGGIVNNYPPVQLDKDGKVIEGSKNRFICYKTFILQKFSNGKTWDISVTRKDNDPLRHLGPIYMQDNMCSDWGANTAMFKLTDGLKQSLLPASLTSAPTGQLTDKNDEARRLCGNRSWLDDLIVVAIKIDGQENGITKSTLTYTLETKTWF
jgi:hypothetical protein